MSMFTGSGTFYRHGINKKVLYSEGVSFLADTAGAYWLVDQIAIAQFMPEVRKEEFQVWKLTEGCRKRVPS